MEMSPQQPFITTKQQGMGVGLSISRTIIEAHGGQIWAENLHDGFAFNFSLPIALDGAPPPKLPIEPEAE